MVDRKIALAWGGMLVLLCGLSWFQVSRHWQLQTDVLALLPHHERDPALQALRHIVSGTLGRTALCLVGHRQPQVARAATAQLGTWMAASPLFETVQWDYSRQRQTFFDLYFPLRYHFLSPTIRRHLHAKNGYQRLVQRLKHMLYQPTSAFATRLLEQDPLLFFPALAQAWGQHTTSLALRDGLLTQSGNGRFYHAITAQIAFNPLEAHGQTQFEDQWANWTRTLQQSWPGLEVTSTSLLRFAAATRKTLHRDIALISGGSILGVVLLTVSTFRTLKHLCLALLPLAAGIWSGLGISLLFFGELHALTLAFGASLIGICVDYSFHYFAPHRVATHWHATRVMRQLFPALSLGACTTVLSYLALVFTPLVGLQQIAVFAATGIAVSFGTVACWFPVLLPQAHPRAQQVPFLYCGADWLCTFWHRFRKPLLVTCGLAMVLCLPGLWTLRIDDRPQALNALPPPLVAQDHLIRHVMNMPQNPTYLVVEHTTAEGALQRLESFHALLRAETDPPFVQLGPVLTAFLPSLKQQQADLLATRTLLDHRRDITAALAQLGFAEHTIQNLFQTIQHEPAPFLRPHVWLQHEASMGLRHLWLDRTTRGTTILVPILQVNDRRKLQDVIAGFDGLHYVDQVEDFSRVFKRYRHQAMRLAGGAYVLIFALLLWRYGRRGYVLMLPPLCAAFLTVCILGLLGQPFHLIHCLALLLILGMGVDYTIFVAESPPDAAPTTLLALTLSALTTLLSFGLLSLSQQAVLQAIGLTTLMGIAIALFLAPIARYGRPT